MESILLLACFFSVVLCICCCSVLQCISNTDSSNADSSNADSSNTILPNIENEVYLSDLAYI